MLCAALLVAVPVLAQQDDTLPEPMQVTLTQDGIATGTCAPACIQPMEAAPGVAPVGELEVLAFLDRAVSAGTGLLVDVRTPVGHAAGSLPGAVNVPAATLSDDNPYRDDLLTALGARDGDFSKAYALVIFAGGPDAVEATEAIRHLIAAGYPASKLNYYRGGHAVWTVLGLSTAPDS